METINKYKKWTEKEETFLINNLRSGLRYDEIAERHYRTRGAIKSRIEKICIRLKNNGYSIKKISEITSLNERLISKYLNMTFSEPKLKFNEYEGYYFKYREANPEKKYKEEINKKKDNNITYLENIPDIIKYFGKKIIFWK
jgi:DNA-binding CsgD family transcriptional regulator